MLLFFFVVPYVPSIVVRLPREAAVGGDDMTMMMVFQLFFLLWIIAATGHETNDL